MASHLGRWLFLCCVIGLAFGRHCIRVNREVLEFKSSWASGKTGAPLSCMAAVRGAQGCRGNCNLVLVLLGVVREIPGSSLSLSLRVKENFGKVL